MLNRMIGIRFVLRFETPSGRRIVIGWTHEPLAKEWILPGANSLPLDDRRQRRQTYAELAYELPAILQETHRHHVGRRGVHNALAANVPPVKKRADDTHKEQHAL